MPQHAMNEIHGAWWDPSNPVVQFDGKLREDLFRELLQWENDCDLCLAVGTSLSGMNADRLVESCGRRAAARISQLQDRRLTSEQEFLGVGGSVIVGFQQTRLDSLATLRIFSSIDKVMLALSAELSIDVETVRDMVFAERAALRRDLSSASGNEDMFVVDKYESVDGSLVRATYSKRLCVKKHILDLRVGRRVKIVSGPNAGSIGEVMERTVEGNYGILFRISPTRQSSMVRADISQYLMLGGWMAAAAAQGMLRELPIVNVV